MSMSGKLLVGCALLLASASFAQAASCETKTLDGRKYSCCQIAGSAKKDFVCDPKVKKGCAPNAVKTTFKLECTPV